MFKDDLKNFAVTYRHIYAATAPLHRLAIYRFLLAEVAQPPLNRWGMTTPEQFLTN